MDDVVGRSVSVVINTLDRADSLAETLEACTQLTHPAFEVIVVCGPSSDHTDEVVARWGDRIVVRRCPVPNLSTSRNIGIAAAAGDVVAFIDDDGVPEPTWLDELCAGYEDPSVGAVGGVVYNHTGRQFQVRFLLSDRLGNTTPYDEMPPGDFCFPGSSRYPSMLGCNSSFRRSALIAVGGFDEQYDYYLDETDVCVRLVDAGWRIETLDGAPVHHKYLPSAVRSREKVVIDLHAVVKNKVYFGLVNGRSHWPWTDVMSDAVGFAAAQREQLLQHRRSSVIDEDGLLAGLGTIDSGWEAGLADGLAGRQRLLRVDDLERRELRPLETRRSADRRRIVLVSRTLPPEHPGGVGRYFLDLARGLARRGHEVRIVTSSESHDRVDLEQGVWIHRVRKAATSPQPGHLPPVPAPLWDNAGPVADEVLRIHRERPVDVVVSPIWDVEWVGVHGASSLPIVSAYTTPFSVVRATQPEAVSVDAAVADAIEALETWAHGSAHAFQVNGEHIAASVERVAGVVLDRDGVFVAPLGTEDVDHGESSGDPSSANEAEGAVDDAARTVTAFFVGRFERRKGVDVLLDAIPRMVELAPRLRVVLAGDDALPDGTGSTYRQRFESEHRDLVESGAVEFVGRVDDDELARRWATADLAILPSRFESFGLVYTEAMARGLPVVALDSSGAEEVVEHGRTGLLCPEDPEAIADAVAQLVGDAAARRGMGRAGRERYDAAFTVEAMTDRFEVILTSVGALRPGVDWAADPTTLVPLADGSTGQLVTSEPIEIEVPTGRVTLVLAGPGGPQSSTVEVRVGPQPVTLELRGDEFHHLVLRAGEPTVQVRTTHGPPARLAAMIVADAAAART